MTYNELCEAILTAQEELLKRKIEANSVTLNGRKYGKLIDNCPPNMKPTIFGMAVKADYALPDDCDFLAQYEPLHPKTNADRIRAMSDEELADILLSQQCSVCDYQGFCDDDEMPNQSKMCKNKILEWLKQEVHDA